MPLSREGLRWVRPEHRRRGATLAGSVWIRPGIDVSAARSTSMRTCIGCRARTSPDGLLRVVLEAGTVVPDPAATRPGRGAWLHPGCLEAAERRKAFTRALRASGAVDLGPLREFAARTS